MSRKKEVYKIQKVLSKQETQNRLNAMKVEKHRNEILKEADALQVQMTLQVNDLLKEVTKSQEQVAATIYALVKEMNQMDVEPVAEVFINMYRILAVSEEEKPDKTTRNMRVLLRVFEKALSGLGLVTFYPKDGTAYNEEWHKGVNEGSVIARCLVPGIVKVSAGGNEVLYLAEVELKEMESKKKFTMHMRRCRKEAQ